MSRIKQSASELLLAKLPGETIVGFALGSPVWSPLQDSPRFELSAIFVNQHHRNRGIGTALIRRASLLAFELGCDAIHVTAVADTAVERFYSKQGFARIGSRWRASVAKK